MRMNRFEATGSSISAKWFTAIAMGLAIVFAAHAIAQAPAPTGSAAAPLSTEELSKLVGPIALYPDDLVAIILPASTNPLQLVQADRFLDKRKTDPKLPVDDKWDDAVKSLLNYPDVVKMMSDDLDWTTALGEAVVADQGAVIEAVQAFRRKAKAAGNLKSDDKQVVKFEQEMVSIEPADPQVIYVPQYNPTTVVVSGAPVYGYYPTPYPSYYYPYAPGAALAAGVIWGAAIGAAWSGNRYGCCGDTNINIDRNTNINRPGGGTGQRPAGGRSEWKSNKQPGQVSNSIGKTAPSTRVGDARGGEVATGRLGVRQDAQRRSLPVAEWAAVAVQVALLATAPSAAMARGDKPKWIVPAAPRAAGRCPEQGRAAVLRGQRRVAAVGVAVVAAVAAGAAEAVAAGVVEGRSKVMHPFLILRQASLMNSTRLWSYLRRLALALLVAAPLVVAAAPQKTFATPEAAVDALMAALKADSDSDMIAIFGEEHKDLVLSSDRAATSAIRAKILAAMETLRVLQEPSSDRRVLLIGDEAWPVPIPIVRAGDRWRFATEDGEAEIVNRRIGGNELNAIYVSRAYIDAQRAYAMRDRDGDGVLQYAQKLASARGKHDGLYWPADAAKGDEESPFGPLIAESAAYLKGHGAGDPYRGYQFRILTRQGKNAPGGAYNYVINGRMIAGFAMVAYPAEYGRSGVMTFIVSHNGKVYQKDLGKDSAAIGAKMATFDPGSGWQEVAR